jgi:hypothetical protein
MAAVPLSGTHWGKGPSPSIATAQVGGLGFEDIAFLTIIWRRLPLPRREAAKAKSANLLF